MKIALKYIAPVALTGLLFSCNQKSDKPSGSADVDTGNLVEDVVDELLPARGASRRAEHMGFAAHLPKDTECLLGFYRGKELLDQLRASSFGAWIEGRVADEGVQLDQVEKSQEAQMVGSLFAAEVLLAFGAETPAQSALLVKMSEESSYIQARMLLSELVRGLGGESEAPEQLLLSRVDSYLDLLAQAEMPPVTIAMKAGSANAEALLPLIMGALEDQVKSAPEGIFTELTIERLGSQLQGFKLQGSGVAALMQEMQFLEQSPLAAEQNARLLDLIKARDLVFVSGVVGDHLVMMVGPSEDRCVLVDQVEDSVLAREEMNFLDPHLKNPLLSVIFASEELQRAIAENGGAYQAYIEALKDGLVDVPALGDVRDLFFLFDRFTELDGRLRRQTHYSDFGAVAFQQDGVKLEAYGGMSLPGLDSDSERQLAPLSRGEEVFLFANWKGDADYARQQSELLDTLGEILWVVANKAAQLDAELPQADLAELREALNTLNGEFGEELDQIIAALRGDVPAGFGTEGAVVVDLKGEFPALPEMPSVLADEAKLPRLALVQQVKDRERLQQAWTKLEAAGKSILEKTDSGIPVPNFLTSEKDGMTTYFYPIPFQTDDFLPSLTIGDEWFFLSSSKNFVYELNARLAAGGAADARRGAVVDMNFAPLQAYFAEHLDLLEEHGEEILGDEFQEFAENKTLIIDFIKSIESLDSCTYHLREEAGMPRASLHLKIN